MSRDQKESVIYSTNTTKFIYFTSIYKFNILRICKTIHICSLGLLVTESKLIMTFGNHEQFFILVFKPCHNYFYSLKF